MRHTPIPHVDYEPVPFVNQYDLQPGMIVRPRTPSGERLDDKRWKVERVSGAFTRCSAGGGQHPASQYWATDSLKPVKFKRTATTISDQQAPGAERHVRKGKAASTEPDQLAEDLKACHGLDALLAYAAAQGYPDCDTLRSRVSHLNPGLQRMNVGNRLRRWLGAS